MITGSFALSFFHSHFSENFMHISGSIELITLIWVALEKPLPPGELSIDDANFGQR